MPKSTGIPREQPEPNVGRFFNDKDAGKLSELLKWNMEAQQAFGNLAAGEKLPKQFDRLSILPRFWTRRESGFFPSGKNFEDKTDLPEVRSIQLEFPPKVQLQGGVMKSDPVMKVLYLPGRSTAGEHIMAGYTAEDCARAIFRDPNWCHAYVIWPMTEEEDRRVAGILSDSESMTNVEKRKKLLEIVDEINLREFCGQSGVLAGLESASGSVEGSY